jgi:putative resolvase
MTEQYVSPKKASEILGVHWLTLKNWESKGYIDSIRTPGGKRMYNVNKYLNQHQTNNKLNNIRHKNNKEDGMLNICYCRVSSRNQINDLKRQEEYMKLKYPKYEIISEIGSGLNLNRPKLIKIIKLAIDGKINEIVVAHKDRLARFGFELIETIVRDYSNGKIIVINKKSMSPEEEMTKDLVSIINVFSARINGLRKYKNLIKNGK